MGTYRGAPAAEDGIAKLRRRAEASEYSSMELDIVLDVLANHYGELDETWSGYYETLLLAAGGTKP